MSTTVRQFGSHRFTCERPGCWVSDCGRFGIYHMMAGTAYAQWEVFELPLGEKGDPLDGDMISCGLSMAEAVCDAFDLPFDEVFRNRGISSSIGVI